MYRWHNKLNYKILAQLDGSLLRASNQASNQVYRKVIEGYSKAICNIINHWAGIQSFRCYCFSTNSTNQWHFVAICARPDTIQSKRYVEYSLKTKNLQTAHFRNSLLMENLYRFSHASTRLLHWQNVRLIYLILILIKYLKFVWHIITMSCVLRLPCEVSIKNNITAVLIIGVVIISIRTGTEKRRRKVIDIENEWSI